MTVEEPASGAVSLIPAGLDAVLVLLRHGETEFIVQKRFQGAMEAPLTPAGERQATPGRQAPRRPHRFTGPADTRRGPLLDPSTPRSGRARRSAELVAEELTAAGRDRSPTPARAGLLRDRPGRLGGADRYGDHATLRRLAGELAPLAEPFQRAGRRDPLAGRGPRPGRALRGCSPTWPWAPSLARTTAIRSSATKARPGTSGAGRSSSDTAASSASWPARCSGLPMDHFWNFDFGLAAITVVEIRAGRAVMRSLNLDAHLGRDSALAEEESRERNARGAL